MKLEIYCNIDYIFFLIINNSDFFLFKIGYNVINC